MRVMLVFLLACSTARRPDQGDVDAPSGTVDLCHVHDDGNGVPNCTQQAPPNSFEPDIQWTWTGPDGETDSIVTPLVANLTDDNGDGSIDLCDTPDVVVVALPPRQGGPLVGHIYILDGKTGQLELKIPTDVDPFVTPAIGDIDHDGIPDIVAAGAQGQLYAFDHTGKIMWGPADASPGSQHSGAIALADLDHDGYVEIISGNTVYDDHGHVLWMAPGMPTLNGATTAADLDGDGFMEVVLGNAAYHHDGTLYWQTTLAPGFPQIANLTGGPEPEVLLTNDDGLSLITHDGHVIYQDMRPTGVAAQNSYWLRPATIHDFDGTGKAQFATSSATYYTSYSADAAIRWSTQVSDLSGAAAGTAFDFLGDGTAEAMYADESSLYVFGDHGQVLLKIARTSGTAIEYPVVADIDNDGSAEIVVVSNGFTATGTVSPTVQVIRDKMDRWVQARRIWNQHTYHVTNVREDGTIPQYEVPSWTQLNTFRTNAQINGAGVCTPSIL